MVTPSLKRQRALVADQEKILQLYREACSYFGEAVVNHRLTHIWDMRCKAGIEGRLPFLTGLVAQNLKEVLWVATELLQLGNTPKARRG